MNAACQRQQNPPARAEAEASAWARAGLIIISIVKFCTPKSEVTYLPDPALSLSLSRSSSAESIVCFCLTKTVEWIA